MINELRLLDIMNANRNNPQGLIAPDVSQSGNVPGIDLDILRQAQGIERQPMQPQVDQPNIQLGDPATPDDDMGFAERQLREMLGHMPVRNKPGKMATILAGIAGVGSRDPQAVGQSIKYAPYNREMQDWNARLEPLKLLATAESQRRTNERLIQSSERTAGLTEERLRETERNNRERVRTIDARNEIAEFRAHNPSYKSVVAKDGKLVLWNPLNGDTKETGIDTGKLDDATKLNLQIEGRLDQAAEAGRQARLTAAVTGDQARKTEGVRQTGRLELSDRNSQNAIDRGTQLEGVKASHREALLKLQQSGAIELRKTPTGNFMITAGAGGKGLLPTQEKVDRLNRMSQIISQFPELEEYFEIDPNTAEVKIAPSSSGFLGMGGTDEKERMKAYNLLFPPKPVNAPKIPANSPQEVRPSATPAEPTSTKHQVGEKRQDGKVWVRDKNTGTEGWTANPNLPQYR